MTWRDVSIILLLGASAAAQTSRTDARLEKLLKQYPQADTDGDGVLTQAEFIAFRSKQKGGAAKGEDPTASMKLPPGAVRRTEMVAMRDGVRLATDIYLPAEKGVWPVVLVRTPYHRTDPNQAQKAAPLVGHNYAFVIQDLRGLFESEKKFPPHTVIGITDPEDGYDTVEWIARQPWSNGKVGITGGSGPGFAAKQTVRGNPPHLVAAFTSVSGMFPRDFALYNGGVPVGWADQWVKARGVPVDMWPKPRPLDLVTNVGSAPIPVVFGAWPPHHKEAAPAGRIATLDNGGWFDFFTPAALDDFNALHGPNNKVIMRGKAHGVSMGGTLKFPGQDLEEASEVAWFDHWLKGVDNGVEKAPRVRYYLMGDGIAGGAPGNVWKASNVWPVPARQTPYYLSENGSLSLNKPAAKNAALEYAYDPRDPVPSVGASEPGSGRGPVDRRALRDRKDILRFATAPLTAPVEVTGRVLAELYISSDVADTDLFAALVDIYPNGYEAQMLNNSLMARYRDGFARPSPMQAGHVYKLTVDMWPTALVFAKGHRIGLQVSSSYFRHWDVHPNTWEPVMSFDKSPVAHISLKMSTAYASKLLLPVIVQRR